MRAVLRAVPFALSLLPSTLCAQEPAHEPAAVPAALPAAAILLGSGAHTYRWVTGWAHTADGEDLGNTHGCMVMDRAGNLLANTDTEQAVVIFGQDGAERGSWGESYKGGLHGMCHRVEDGEEMLYLAHTGRHEVVKTTLAGEVLWTIGWPKESGVYDDEGQFKPTAVAVAPDGRIYVGDGYGRSWIHVFDRDRKYVKSFGGPGKEDGKLRTPHGLWLDTRAKTPLLLVCDRENHRLQWFTLDGEFVRKMDQDLRRPCNVWPLAGGELAVADLVGRVTILGADDKPIVHLGDNPDPKKRAVNGVPREQWADGEFLSPHSVCADAAGNLYVMDWNFLGRITKLEKVAVARAGGDGK
ncbi:MAG: peptidase [Planctomycetes bacterium]|nr:peptidase [Planctomycetota bacterium]